MPLPNLKLKTGPGEWVHRARLVRVFASPNVLLPVCGGSVRTANQFVVTGEPITCGYCLRG